MNGVLITRAFNGIFVDDVWVTNDNIEDETFVCASCGERHLRGACDENIYECEGDELCEACADDETFMCDRCGERHYAHESYTVIRRGWEEQWCEVCTDDYSSFCDECGDRHANSELTYVESTNSYVCDSCLEDNYSLCDCCGEYFRDDDLTNTADGRTVCENCLEEGYTYCVVCHEWVDNDDFDYERNMCNDCVDAGESREVAEQITNTISEMSETVEDSNTVPRSDNARVRGYHSRPCWWNTFVGEPNALNNTAYAGIGVELEVDIPEGGSAQYMQRALNRIDRITGSNRVYFNHDCSLRDGFEIISRPHTLEAFDTTPWGEIMDACKDNGFASHDAGTCGLHFHFSRLMFGDDEDTQDDNIAKLMQFFEFYWDDIVKLSRREGNQLRWCGRKGYVSKKRIKKYVKDKRGGHDESINNSNRDTVEVRVMRGTLNINTFNASLDLLVTLIKNACRVGWDEVCEAEEMLKGIKHETCDYLLRRNAFYQEAYDIRFHG